MVRGSKSICISQRPAAQSASELAEAIPKVAADRNKVSCSFLSLYRREPKLEWSLIAGYRHEGSVTVEQT